MNISGDHWSISPSDYTRPQKASDRPPAAKSKASRAEDTSASGLHKADDLRKAVERLMESGDVKSGSDGPVRESRVDRARQNTGAGAYNNTDVLGQIVDRLLDQWKI
jgi:hypothetical protein